VDCEENTKYIGEVADVEEEECEGMEEGICRRYTVEILEGDFEGEDCYDRNNVNIIWIL
jgi:hypothetical protein